MKTLMLLITMVLVMTQAAQADIIEKVISKQIYNTVMVINEDTYVFNVNGYACQWPGLRIARHQVNAQLNHLDKFGSDANYLAMGIQNPDHQFCHTTREKAFGKELVPNAELPIKVTRVLDIRRHDNGDTYLQESITVEINDRTVESIAQVPLSLTKDNK
ncbi:MAG: hypothetical protein A2622_02855 [Bdellovibrionales bacterium RIFCSPHIGHO2_01_FULL_40_29]|nr:MAG: hypothetical protein A2622_02855 [Bdellovibrionales bacterium RIFCSPHIGHO2_01_FULL_40_29]OFZ34015.1 MAG: hypothetical protein A3D17_03275 [Bdellovibrionales bacterium RIFCSPHIGHO2_02_FULL_40_15]